jgi:hypothetical protein
VVDVEALRAEIEALPRWDKRSVPGGFHVRLAAVLAIIDRLATPAVARSEGLAKVLAAFGAAYDREGETREPVAAWEGGSEHPTYLAYRHKFLAAVDAKVAAIDNLRAALRAAEPGEPGVTYEKETGPAGEPVWRRIEAPRSDEGLQAAQAFAARLAATGLDVSVRAYAPVHKDEDQTDPVIDVWCDAPTRLARTDAEQGARTDG